MGTPGGRKVLEEGRVAMVLGAFGGGGAGGGPLDKWCEVQNAGKVHQRLAGFLGVPWLMCSGRAGKSGSGGLYINTPDTRAHILES